MLTGTQVRVRYARDRIVPYFIDPHDPEWLAVAESLLLLFRGMDGKTRGELEQELDDLFGEEAGTLVQQGLAKLLEDRCGFQTEAGHPPEELRKEVFRAAVEMRTAPPPEGQPAPPFDREEVLRRVALKLSLAPEQIGQGLYADLKSEQRLISFDDLSAEHLLLRYNVGLAQAVLLRAVKVHLTITGEPPVRWRAILRRLKFHRLLCEMERIGETTYVLHLDGPLSLFSATTKYGLQLALFLTAVLPCKNWELKAELRWGAQKKPKTFLLTHKDKLEWPGADPGQHVPAELGMFAESFRKRIEGWELREEPEAIPLGNGWWVPDYRLVHKATGKPVLLEV
ncbi:MAG: DUF790 family protein, partial [Gemmataceae bacterium]|nr:DUF790 family protein [Gemmataceae bacterium]